MKTSHSACYLFLAGALDYPAPGGAALLSTCVTRLLSGSVRDHAARFVDAVARMPVSDWEELYTRTFDLNPLVAPYVGYQVWGEHYRRGSFLALMSRTLAEAGVDRRGELPDHLGPVLRYLATTDAPLPELAEILAPALERMASTLQQADANNPYTELLLAVQLLWASAQAKEPA